MIVTNHSQHLLTDQSLMDYNIELKQKLKLSYLYIDKLKTEIVTLKQKLELYYQKADKTPKKPYFYEVFVPEDDGFDENFTDQYDSSYSPDNATEGGETIPLNGHIKLNRYCNISSVKNHSTSIIATSQNDSYLFGPLKQPKHLMKSYSISSNQFKTLRNGEKASLDYLLSGRSYLSDSYEEMTERDKYILKIDCKSLLSNSSLKTPPSLFSLSQSSLGSLSKLTRMESEGAEKPKMFKKISNSKPLFNCFFVTGMFNRQPCVTYSFPRHSAHFSAILSFCYTEHSIKQIEPYLNSQSMYIRDSFVIPLRKYYSITNDVEYLVACESYYRIWESSGDVFPRYYCFLTSCKFFKDYFMVISKLISKIAKQLKTQPCTSYAAFEKVIQQYIEPALQVMLRKSADENKTLSFSIDDGIRIDLDIPPVEYSYKIIEYFKPWSILNLELSQRAYDGQPGPLKINSKLFGILLIYLLAEIKIVLYSKTKSKISEALLQAFQIMQPFEYVNPLLMAAFKEDYEEYLSAPMSIVMGLWGEHRNRSNRRKIELFINKKCNWFYAIENKQLADGVLINLDTGLIFGGGLRQDLTEVGGKLNDYRDFYCKCSRDMYLLFEKMVGGRSESKDLQDLWNTIKPHLLRTQMYSYYKERIAILE